MALNRLHSKIYFHLVTIPIQSIPFWICIFIARKCSVWHFWNPAIEMLPSSTSQNCFHKYRVCNWRNYTLKMTIPGAAIIHFTKLVVHNQGSTLQIPSSSKSWLILSPWGTRSPRPYHTNPIPRAPSTLLTPNTINVEGGFYRSTRSRTTFPPPPPPLLTFFSKVLFFVFFAFFFCFLFYIDATSHFQ